MKKILALLAVMILACMMMCSCGNNSSEEPAEGDIISTDYTELAGTYTITEDESSMVIGEDGTVNISITRLASMDGEVTGIYDGNMALITVEDPNGEGMGLEFTMDDNTLVVTDSQWDLLPNGEEFVFDEKK